MYDIVRIPKYWRNVFLEPYRSAMKTIIHKVSFDYDIDIVELEIPEEHIHLVVKSEPRVSPSHIMQVVQSISGQGSFGSRAIMLRQLEM